MRARLVAAADGRESPLRRAAGIQTIEWRYPQTGIVTTVRHQRPHNGIAVEHFMRAGPFAILPMTENRSSIVWTERGELAPRLVALSDAAFAAELAARFGDFLGPVEPLGPRWTYPLTLLLAERYVATRLALVGEAAHTIHPIAGQGLNLGIRDVAALAELVIDARRLGLDIGDESVLVCYQQWRRFDALALVAVTDGLNRLFSNSLPLVQLARDIGLAAVNRLPPLKRLLMRDAMGIAGDLPRLVRGEPQIVEFNPHGVIADRFQLHDPDMGAAVDQRLLSRTVALNLRGRAFDAQILSGKLKMAAVVERDLKQLFRPLQAQFHRPARRPASAHLVLKAPAGAWSRSRRRVAGAPRRRA
jgi:hypothetical protein